MTRFLVLNLLAAIAAALVAERKGRNWALWALLCGFFPILLIVLVFLPHARSGPGVKQCPSCGGPMQADATDCPHCGKEQPIEMVECPKCGAFVPQGQKCPDCKG